jgi:hypothetical protein
MLEDAQREVRLEFLRTERSRLQEIINISQDVEANARNAGKHEDAERQRQHMTLPARQELEVVQEEIRKLEYAA